MITRKGQTALEYLLILVVALVVVALVYFWVQGTSESAQEQGNAVLEEISFEVPDPGAGCTLAGTGFETPTYVSVSASSSQTGFPPENGVDGGSNWISLSTPGPNEEYLNIDLGDSVCIDAIIASVYINNVDTVLTIGSNGEVLSTTTPTTPGWNTLNPSFPGGIEIDYIRIKSDISSTADSFFAINFVEIRK